MTKHGAKNHTTNHRNSHYHEQHHHQTDVNAHHNKAITSVGSAEEGEEAFHEAAEPPPLSDGGILPRHKAKESLEKLLSKDFFLNS
jgi:hypothetical protein